jgi:lipopolysaccharide/colanic/teichoic acid biosynthesis glycosyltransferase
MYKLRTLRPDAEERLRGLQDVELDKLTEGEHTRVGRVLRATQLDELPQLYNVLRGDMSIVGPRPIRPVFFEELVIDIPQYWQRLVVRPGLTGFAQLRMRRDTTWAEKLAHDLEYLADRSPRLYMRIVIATAGRLLARTRTELSRAVHAEA